jgi:two-component system, cell cycle sensor histidine kinase and response regulator CckA
LSREEFESMYSFKVVRKDEETLWVQLNTVLIDWEGKPATINFLRDVTPQKKPEEQLQHAQKMEAVGTLAGEALPTTLTTGSWAYRGLEID